MMRFQFHRWKNLFNQRVKFRPFTIAFQPIVELEAGSVWGYEALVRGRASEPYPVLTGGMTERRQAAFDRLAIAKSLTLAKRLGLLDTEARLSLNLRPGALALVSAKYVARAAQACGVPAARIVLEMTEDTRVTARQMDEIVRFNRDAGMQTAIDDFGAGYAGLSTLAGSRADVLKLDRELIRGVDGCETRQAIIGAVVRVSRQMKSILVAEGVETPGECACLVGMGVTHMQGYWFARPGLEYFPAVPAEKLVGERAGIGVGLGAGVSSGKVPVPAILSSAGALGFSGVVGGVSRQAGTIRPA